MLTVNLTVRTDDQDEAQSYVAALSGVLTTLVRNGATDAGLSIGDWADDEEPSEEDVTVLATAARMDPWAVEEDDDRSVVNQDEGQ